MPKAPECHIISLHDFALCRAGIAKKPIASEEADTSPDLALIDEVFRRADAVVWLDEDSLNRFEVSMLKILYRAAAIYELLWEDIEKGKLKIVFVKKMIEQSGGGECARQKIIESVCSKEKSLSGRL